MSVNAEVHAAIGLLGEGLDPHIERVLGPHLGQAEWPAVLKILDADKGKSGYTYARHDVALQLRMITERLGSLGFPFDVGDKNRTLSAYGSVLRIVRKRWAHNDEFSPFDGIAAIETIRTVLAHIGDSDRAAQAAELRTKVVSSLRQEEEEEEEEASAPTDQTVGVETRTDPGGDARKTPGEAHVGTTSGNGSKETGLSVLGASRMVDWAPWEIAVVGEQEDLDNLRSKRVKELVRSLIEDIVDAEGPVHRERLGRLVGYAFGFSRVRDKRLARVLGQVKSASVLADADGFVWQQDLDRSKWLISRIAPSGGRVFEEISPIELANALVEILRQEGELPVVDASRRVLALFGRTRLSKQSTEHFHRAMAQAEQAGRVTVQDESISLAAAT